MAKDYQFMERNWFDTDKAKYNGKTINQHYEAAQRDQERAWRTKNAPLEKDANARLSFWENIMTHNHPEKVVSDALQDPTDWPELSAYVKKIDQSKFEGIPSAGSLYSVDLPDEKIAQMLDWDKPFSEQSELVRNALSATKNKHVRAMVDYANAPYQTAGLEGEVKSLGEALKLLNLNVTPKKASEFLRQAGIPGIKYFDAGSRDAKKGTRNFVVFPGEEKHLKILERK